MALTNLRRRMVSRRSTLHWALATGAMAAAPVLRAQEKDYPSRPIRIVVPLPPGGANDLLARVIASHMTSTLGGVVLVENRPGGGGGSVGAESVSRAQPDGYTLLLANTATLAINQHVYPDLKYDPIIDFLPISLLCTTSLVLLVPSSSPAKTVAELVAMLKADPGKYNYGSPGNGTPMHVAAEQFKIKSNTQAVHVPYRGAAPAITALLGGEIDILFDTLSSSLPHIRSGKFRALAMTGTQRNPQVPDVPTIAEAGLPDAEARAFLGLVAPKGTPAPIVDRLSRAAIAATKDPEIRKRLIELDFEPWGSSPGEMKSFVVAEAERWKAAVRSSGAKVQ